jgi:hypothetical protein
MTITHIPPVEAVSMDARTEMARCLTAAASFIAVHDVPLPGAGKVYLSIRVPPGPRGERIEALQQIAEQLGTTLVKRRGALFAEKEFGVVVLEAHVRDTALWTRCASEKEVYRTAARWEADGCAFTPVQWNPVDLQVEARRLDDGGQVAEVAWWSSLEDAPEMAQAVTATGNAA